MGASPPHSTTKETDVVDALQNHPTSYIQFAAIDNRIVGMAVCFLNYSTFKAAHFMNVHDLVVLPDYRGMGIGKLILHGVALKAVEKKCAKLTLEIRSDNQVAAALYAKIGFRSCAPPMEYLTKDLPTPNRAS